MTTIVKAAGSAQFLSLVPRMLGFTPVESLVLVPFAGSRSIGAMRLDLPVAASNGDRADGDAFAATCIGMVCRIADANAFALVVYTSAGFTGDAPPEHELARALLARADACGLRVVDALCVGPDSWGSYVDAECPGEGRPLSDLDLPAPSEVFSAIGDQHTGSALPAVDDDERMRVADAFTALRRSARVLFGEESERPSAVAVPATDGDPGRVDPLALAAVCRLDDLPTLFESALGLGAEPFDPYLAATFAWCLARPALRDVALVQWCAGFAAGDEALDAQLRWERGEPYPDRLAMRMWGEGERPDAARLEQALVFARRLAAVAPERAAPGALATCAWVSWALGRSTHAEHYAREACRIDPEHGLAAIVLSFVSAGHLPDWAFRRPESARAQR